MDTVQVHIESLIFAAINGISIDELKTVLQETLQLDLTADAVRDKLNTIEKKYEDPQYPFMVLEINQRFQFLSKPDHHRLIASYQKYVEQKKLSKSALETLAIIAYKQPCTKAEIESIRGVNCEYSIQKLLDKELVSILGRSDGPGRPILYGTSSKFMDHFGLKAIEDLPQYKDIVSEKDEIGASVQDISQDALKQLSDN